MVGERRNPDEVPEYGTDDLDIFFSFKVHHGGQFDVSMDNYNGGSINYFDYISLDELSMLDLDDIAIKLKYKLPVGYWIKLPGGDEMMPSQQPESQDLLYSDDEDNRAVADNEDNGPAEAADTEDGPTGFGDGPVDFCSGPAGFGDGPVNEEGDEQLIEEDAERAKSQRKNKGKYIIEEAEEAEEEEEVEEEAEEAEADKVDELVESDYDQEAEDIAAETCVDPTNDWESLQISDLPRGSRSDKDDGSEDLGSLDGSNGEEDAEGPVRKFIKRRKAIRAHSMKHRRVVKFKKNDPNRIRVVCKDEGCQWRENPDWNFAGMAKRLRSDTNVDASKWQYYRARSAAREIIQGSVKEQYSKLWEYGAEILRMNPNNSVIMKCSTAAGGAKPRFQRLYMCLGALKQGWKEGCRPILGLDGCFIKGHHTGQLLTAIGVDPNNQMYPVAYALVESECRETWLWFLELLGVDLEINNSHGIVCITDKQKGLIDAIRELFPHSEHRYCVKHFYNNFKASHKGLLLKQLLWGAAKSTTKQGFTQYMERLRMESEAAYQWLANKDPLHWSRAFFKDTALCDMLCNNMCEAFNLVILQARDKPVITLMEMIRVYLMKRLVTKRAEVQKWHHQIGPKVMKFVEKIKMESSICNPAYCGNYVFQVKEIGGEQFVVNIEQMSCACNKWQLIGIPCIHGMAAILSSNRDPLDFIHIKYKKESFVSAYTPVIYGINGPNMWPKTNDIPVECPDFKKQRGRPKKARNLQSDEVMIGGKRKLRRNYIVVNCSKCGQGGHNRSTCEKRGGKNVAGNANGRWTQPVQSTQGSSVQPRQASSHSQHVQPRQASSQNEPVWFILTPAAAELTSSSANVVWKHFESNSTKSNPSFVFMFALGRMEIMEMGFSKTNKKKIGLSKMNKKKNFSYINKKKFRR
ncbi:hypothetical protein Q3G72_012209 [Acer saccharum]|nr:hypothetical protein Q3G72_012209 [Acer saccharum]